MLIGFSNSIRYYDAVPGDSRFLDNLSEPTFDPDVFETSWEAFWQELLEPEWTRLGVANLQNFRSESMLLNLGDGITIRGRSGSRCV